MHSVDISAALVREASAKLATKEGTCDVPPKVRFTVYDTPFKATATLVCCHRDAGLNCGTGADHCTRCLDKEKQYAKNKQFSRMLFEKAAEIGEVINLKEPR